MQTLPEELPEGRTSRQEAKFRKYKIKIIKGEKNGNEQIIY
jgi:hypothetical protein